jgi:hypothetical protein
MLRSIPSPIWDLEDLVQERRLGVLSSWNLMDPCGFAKFPLIFTVGQSVLLSIHRRTHLVLP